MKKLYHFLFILCCLVGLSSTADAQGTWKLRMYDVFGDGWNGSSININGTVYTLADGAFQEVDLPGINIGSNVTITKQATGSFTYEVSFAVIAPTGLIRTWVRDEYYTNTGNAIPTFDGFTSSSFTAAGVDTLGMSGVGCEFGIFLQDQFADGWNGGYITVNPN